MMVFHDCDLKLIDLSKNRSLLEEKRKSNLAALVCFPRYVELYSDTRCANFCLFLIG